MRMRNDHIGAYRPWFIHSDTVCLFEIPTSALCPLPKPLQAREVRPGVGLLCVTRCRYAPANLGWLPAFSELTVNVIVEPLVEGWTPHFAFYVLSIASSSPDYDEWTQGAEKMPVFTLDQPRFEGAEDDRWSEIGDAAGPIVRLSHAHPSPEYRVDVRDCQVYTEVEGELWSSRVRIHGPMFEHQRRNGDIALHPHPVFRGVELDQVERSPWAEWTTKPGELLVYKHYEARPLRERSRR